MKAHITICMTQAESRIPEHTKFLFPSTAGLVAVGKNWHRGGNLQSSLSHPSVGQKSCRGLVWLKETEWK